MAQALRSENQFLSKNSSPPSAMAAAMKAMKVMKKKAAMKVMKKKAAMKVMKKKAVMKKAVMKAAMKARKAMKAMKGMKRKLNAFFALMLAAKKKGDKSFVYNGKTYVGSPHPKLGLIYR